MEYDLLSKEAIPYVLKALEEAEKEDKWITFEELKDYFDKKFKEDMKKYNIEHKKRYNCTN